ncbi:MAG: hypothetical protein JXA89_16080 [Anaerolineae bacterium]|nr:hypothetical protein [Anaerolineae bacterium]
MQQPERAEAENARAVPRPRTLYTLENLRVDIRAAELAIANINPKSSANQILGLFALLDRIVSAHEAMSQKGIDLRPETTRIETLYGILNDKGRTINRVLNKLEGLAVLRTKHNPPPNHWWWYLDQHVDRQKKDQKKRRVRNLGIVAFVLAAAAVIYMAFLRPDATTRKKVALILVAEADLQNKDYVSALASYQQAQILAPDDAEINLMIGIMYQALNRPRDAKNQFAETAKLYENEPTFVSVRSQKYSSLGWYNKALSDALRAIALDQRFASGYCALATAYEGQGHYANAISALQVCADLAFEQGQDELYVVAKTHLGYLLQTPK